MDNSIGSLPPGLEALSIDRQRETAKGSGELQQEQFLELMLTQLQNQDPMKPMESGEFLGQLAQFGTVTGIGELQQSFSSLAASLQSSQALQASTMVGRSVLIESDTVAVKTQTEMPLSVELPAPADEVRVVISDAAGQVVRQLNLGSREHGLADVVWDGMDADGVRVAPGNYKIEAAALFNGEAEALPTLIQAPVESVTLSRDGQPPVLNLTDIGAVDLSIIKRVL